MKKKAKIEITEITEQPVENPLDAREERAKLAVSAEKFTPAIDALKAKTALVIAQSETVMANCGRLAEYAKTGELAQNYGFAASQVLLAIDDVLKALDLAAEAVEKTRG